MLSIIRNVLKSTKQKGTRRKIYGLDVETTDNNRKFYCVSIYLDDENHWTYYNKRDAIEFLKTKRFEDSFVVASNLLFDYNALFFGEPEEMQFNPRYRGSDMMYAKTWITHREFTSSRLEKTSHSVTFLDTYNYCKMSVDKMGKILEVRKHDKPKCLGRIPENDDEYKEMASYNLQDAKISKIYAQFLFDSFIALGASPKDTISQVALSLWKNRYLGDDVYYRQDVHDMDEIFLAYYGGRVEAFKRGRMRKRYHYYDFNSLYPSVMTGWFPDPNSHRVTYKNTIDYIMNYEGVSLVDVECPEMKIPLLPFRTTDKLVFPTGKFHNWQTHVELRKALSLGYKITKVHKTHYYKKMCQPFKEYVQDLYAKRKQYKADKNPMELVVKLLLNSLYGKFGQKYRDRDNIVPFTHTKEALDSLKWFEPVGKDGKHIRIKEGFIEPSAFTVPIWAAYVTAYGRLKLYDVLINCDPLYCDTDSIICEKEFPTSLELGDLKLELEIKSGFIIRAKFYAMVSDNDEEFVKIKGIGKHLTFDEFGKFLDNPSVTYDKFVKFKEALRRNLVPNEIISITKTLTLEDDKRFWNEAFDKDGLQSSSALLMIDGIESRKYKILRQKAKEAFEKEMALEEDKFLKSDLFDGKSVGKDISSREFLKNEKYFATHQ